MKKPTIRIVTPTLNQESFIEDCIRSILSQNYPNLQYSIYDGGSVDNTVEIIKKYESYLYSWRSGPDNGSYDIINHAFSESDADILFWLNSDDIILPGALQYVSEVFESFQDVCWLTTIVPAFLNGSGDLTANKHMPGISREGWLDGRHLDRGRLHNHGFIQQESTFFRV